MSHMLTRRVGCSDITKDQFYRPLEPFTRFKEGLKTSWFQEAEPHPAVGVVTDIEGGFLMLSLTSPSLGWVCVLCVFFVCFFSLVFVFFAARGSNLLSLAVSERNALQRHLEVNGRGDGQRAAGQRLADGLGHSLGPRQ